LHSNGWKILEEHGPAAHALLLRLTLRRDVADDLLHDLFTKLAHRIGRIENPRAYLQRAAINVAMDWRRRRKKQVDIAGVSEQPATTMGPAAAVEQSDDVERILDAADALTALEYQAFVHRFVQQESFEEIAALLERTPHQARGLCDAATKHIRKELNQRLVHRERSQ
jgi:RNA polymerase sigma factor (sigma-70 family)